MLDRVALPVTTNDGPAKRKHTRCVKPPDLLWAFGTRYRSVERAAAHLRGMVVVVSVGMRDSVDSVNFDRGGGLTKDGGLPAEDFFFLPADDTDLHT